jgi:hypothetical protein
MILRLTRLALHDTDPFHGVPQRGRPPPQRFLDLLAQRL